VEPVILGPPCAASPPSTLVALNGGGHWVVVGPEAARDESGRIVGLGDLRAQLEQVGKKVEACLKVGGRASPISSQPGLTSPILTSSPNTDLRQQYFGSAAPDRTIVQRGGLSNPDNLVEVMAFAAVK
jgi:enamine deaminase RidA (YjgF/YER057c/UK114 family)